MKEPEAGAPGDHRADGHLADRRRANYEEEKRRVAPLRITQKLTPTENRVNALPRVLLSAW